MAGDIPNVFDFPNFETNFQKVSTFHEVFCPEQINGSPTFPPSNIQRLRRHLIAEEFKELRDAMHQKNMIEVADAIADLLYVVYGTAVAFGINADAVFAEVHRSNMSKAGEDGKAIRREDGKVMKGPNYSPPDIKGVLGEFV